jgi:hypothetical protein
MNELIEGIRAEYRRYKALGEAALDQVRDAELSKADSPGDNSLAVICWHLSGNLRSRFSDFLTTDGEKPWRNREEEFDDRVVSREEFVRKWEEGWAAVLGALGELTDEQLFATVTIRQQPLKVYEALFRSLAHTAYHVGQIVYVAKALRGDAWKSPTIPRGQSAAYNQDARFERAGAHAEALKQPPTA